MSEFERDDLEALDPALVPFWNKFNIASYSSILRQGKAAATQRRYDDRADAERDLTAVMKMLNYYRDRYPHLAPEEFGQRLWQSREDGRWRWAVMPEPVRPRVVRR